MLVFLLILAFVICLFIPVTRVVILNLPKYLWDRWQDFLHWTFGLECNKATFLGVRVWIANHKQHMRSGKTLSMVIYAVNYYKQYHDKKIYYKGKKVKQKIIVFSNINLKSIPYLPFESFEQLNEWYGMKLKLEAKDKGSCYKALFVIDEIGVVANNREFKNNFKIQNIRAILTSGHEDILGILGSCQTFGLQDAMLRSIEDYAVSSSMYGILPYKKRVIVNNYFLASDLENADNELDVKPIATRAYYLKDKYYEQYDTHEIVKLVKHEENFISDEDVLNHINMQTKAQSQLTKSKQLKKAERKKK